jgi:4-hydroxy-tetrahydrodipicolinate synthase
VLHTEQELWTAIVTPMNSDGTIDFASFEQLLRFQAKAGMTGLIVTGTTGEGPTVSLDEKCSLIKAARVNLPKSMRIMAGTGTNDTKETLEHSAKALEAGADSLLIVTPPYNKPSPLGLRKHYEVISEEFNQPICLYHVPSRTGQLLSAKLLADLSDIKHIEWIKEASGDLSLFSKVCQLSEAKILSGDDFTYLPSISVGGAGVISVITNILPHPFKAMAEAAVNGHSAKALEIHDVLFELMETLFIETNPGPVKHLTHCLGFGSAFMRLPLAPLLDESIEALNAKFTHVAERLSDLGVGFK